MFFYFLSHHQMNPRCLYFSPLFSITSRITIVTVTNSIVTNVNVSIMYCIVVWKCYVM